MATAARGQSTKAKNQAMAERMKRLGIVRKTGRCPVCYRIVALPIDRHLFGGGCS
jgi:hypothetical protein